MLFTPPMQHSNRIPLKKHLLPQLPPLSADMLLKLRFEIRVGLKSGALFFQELRELLREGARRHLDGVARYCIGDSISGRRRFIVFLFVQAFTFLKAFFLRHRIELQTSTYTPATNNSQKKQEENLAAAKENINFRVQQTRIS